MWRYVKRGYSLTGLLLSLGALLFWTLDLGFRIEVIVAPDQNKERVLRGAALQMGAPFLFGACFVACFISTIEKKIRRLSLIQCYFSIMALDTAATLRSNFMATRHDMGSFAGTWLVLLYTVHPLWITATLFIICLMTGLYTMRRLCTRAGRRV